MTAKIIHAEFNPDAVPAAPEAAAVMAQRAYLAEMTDRKLIEDIFLELQAMRAEQASMRAEQIIIRMNVDSLFAHCRGRTVACNQAATVAPLPEPTGLGEK